MILVRSGMAVVVVVLFCAAVAEFLTGRPAFEVHRLKLALGLGGIGLLMLLAGIVAAKRRRDKPGRSFSAAARMLELRHWGVVMVLLSVITFHFETWDLAGRWQELRTQLEGKPKIVLAREPPETNKVVMPLPAVFPAVKIQGIIFKKDQPVVFINGEPHGVGDFVGEAVVKEITRDGMVLQIRDEVKIVRLGKSPAPSGVAPAGK